MISKPNIIITKELCDKAWEGVATILNKIEVDGQMSVSIIFTILARFLNAVVSDLESNPEVDPNQQKKMLRKELVELIDEKLGNIK